MKIPGRFYSFDPGCFRDDATLLREAAKIKFMMTLQTVKQARQIRKLVCDHYRLSLEVLTAKGKGIERVSTPRQICMCLVYDLLPVTHAYAAAVVGRTCPGTVWYARRRIAGLMETEPSLKREVEFLKNKASKIILATKQAA